jgi:hypothetical protein
MSNRELGPKLVLGSPLEGPRVVRTIMRPLRVAYVIPTNDLPLVAKVIDLCSLTFSGIGSILVPGSPTDGISTEWLQTLKRLDPDMLVDCVGVPQRQKDKFDDLGQVVVPWQRPHTPIWLDGALQAWLRSHPVQRPLGDTAEGPEPLSVLAAPQQEDFANPRYLPALARYGRFNEESLYAMLLSFHDVGAHGYYSKRSAAKELIRVIEVSLSGDLSSLMLGRAKLTPYSGELGFQYESSLLEMTRLGLTMKGEPHSFGRATPERPYQDEAWFPRKNPPQTGGGRA